MFDKDIANVRYRACRTTFEAFPIGPEYGCAIERPRPYPRTLWVTMAVAVAYLGALLLWEVM